MDKFDIIKYILPPTGLFGVLLYLFSKPDKFDKWGSIIYRFLDFIFGRISIFKSHIKRNKISYDIQSIINNASSLISKQAPGIFPYSLRIEWVKGNNTESFMKKGEVIIRLSPKENEEKNFVISSYTYVQKALLPKARNYLDTSLRTACFLTLTKHLISKSKFDSSYSQFYESFFHPQVTKIHQVKDDCRLLDDLYSVGTLTHIFLTEIKKFGDKLHPSTPSMHEEEEIRGFANFLDVIALKGYAENVPLLYESPNIKVGVILLARSGRLEREGIWPYVRRVKLNVKSNCNTVFVCGWGERYTQAVSYIVRQSRQDGYIEPLRKYKFPISKKCDLGTEGSIFVCRPSLEYRIEEKKITDPIIKLFTINTPEIANRIIEIVDIARIPKVGCKVSVRFQDDYYNSDEAVGICLGINAERHKQIRKGLPYKEWLQILPWQSNIEEYIKAAIYHKKANITKIEIDEISLRAIVHVENSDSARLVIGTGGINVKLSTILTGWQIDILSDTE